MELSVVLLSLFIRLLGVLLAPYFWMRGRRPARRVTAPAGLLRRSVTDLAAGIRDGELSSERVVCAFISRVREVNPLLNAVVEERFAEALADARAADRQIAEARARGTIQQLFQSKPLLGVPFTVKESLSVAGMSNAVGFREFAGRRAALDGAAVARLRAAGAVPLLVSCTPELCLGWETGSALSGVTNNPHCTLRTPGGSSGGEAALVSSGASPFGAGSDIAGSLRIPPAFCGIFGHKTTPGVIPITHHVPSAGDALYAQFLSLGPLARHAGDLPLLLAVMAGEQRPLLRLDEPVDLAALNILYMTEAGYSVAVPDVDAVIKRRIRAAVGYLERECGATVSEEKFPEFIDSVEISISTFFSMNDIPNIMQDPVNPKRTKSLLVEFIKCLFGGSNHTLQGLGFAFIDKTKLFIPKTKMPYYSAKGRQLKEKMMRILGNNGVLLYPVFTGVAHYHNEIFTNTSGVAYTMLFNILGMPSTAVPMGLHKGLPVGIQVIAAPNQDRLCLAVAKQLEIGFGGWQPPQ